jgi:hypothetical protein
MRKRSKIIAVIVLCGVTMFMLLISQYKNLNAQGDVTDKSREKLAYQAKGKKIPGRKRANRGKQNVSKDASAHKKNSGANRDKESKGSADFYQVVVENNLFRPLGWEKPNREPQYTLMATLIDSEGNIAKAFMMERRSNQFYYVAVGEKVGDATVKRIRSNEVTLYKTGEMMTIRGEIEFLSGSGGEGGGARSSNRETRSNQNSDKRDGKQLNSREMKSRFQNASPEERKHMLEEYRKTQGNKKQREGKAKQEDKSKDNDKGWAEKGEHEGEGKDEYRGK